MESVFRSVFTGEGRNFAVSSFVGGDFLIFTSAS
jgi:hypothetical protein